MDNQKCLVCGYTFSKEDFNALETVYECPYCHTKKKIYSDNDDFLRKNLLTEGYDHLSKSEIVEASRKFSTFRSQYENYIDDELKLGEALAKCELSNCLNFSKDKMITIVHGDSLSDILQVKEFEEFIRPQNPYIYQNIKDMFHKEEESPDKYPKYESSVLLLSLDKEKREELDRRLSNFHIVLNVDLTDEDVEILVYKNIAGSYGLVVYMEEDSILSNAYFLSIYYRFKIKHKPIIFISPKKARELNPLIRNDKILTWDSTNETVSDKLLNDILSCLNCGNNDNKVSTDFTLSGTEIVEFLGPDCTLPTQVVTIAPLAGYKRKIKSVTVSTTGSLSISERAFSESDIETFKIQSKTCNLKICKDAFSSCKALKTVVFQNNSIVLEDGAFRDCASLKEIDFSGTNLTVIPTHSFDGDSMLEAINFPSNLRQIKKFAFKNSGITKLPSINTSIIVEDNAFSGCKNLKEVTIESSNENNFILTSETFPENCKIILKGKNLKKKYKEYKKNFSEYYQIEFNK